MDEKTKARAALVEALAGAKEAGIFVVGSGGDQRATKATWVRDDGGLGLWLHEFDATDAVEQARGLRLA